MHRLIYCSTLSLLSLAAIASAFAASKSSHSHHFDNPIVEQRADPWLVRHDSGCYTFIGTSPQFDQIELRQSCDLNQLDSATPKVIWQKHDSGPMSLNIWAPELHQIDDHWYIYFAASSVEQPFNIRMYVLANEHENPLEGEWQERGQLTTHIDSFSLDATVFEHHGQHYLAWAQQDAEASYNSAIWLAKMKSPTEIELPPTLLTEPTLDWEIQGYKVNEGPAVIAKHGRIFMTYSASATDHRYAMGLLHVPEDADLLDASVWQKSPQPVFATNAELSRFGPGHNGFVKCPQGDHDLMIYHARDYQQLQGGPLGDPNRHARLRVVDWDEHGMPDFRPAEAD
ncbi:family 43 glycosylhydrolase [Neiella sp. HB171785]|uniref:Family 43 glycosylhydrolase n=1 Tax=Neiella litorisoli TaxID=2771431 RepID=A0A8J6ULI5_9GAMM|nr:family 43 glycosylhydrolase [Neiella litorisoli]MBD1389040.1 family 43 glycosylhydrolase [Neiella litorisoli]